MTPPSQTHYATLGINPDANKAEISSAYKRLALKHHPDKHSTPSAKEENTILFRNVQEAYEVLSDAARRETYDRTNTPRPNPQPSNPFPRSSRKDHHRAAAETAHSAASIRTIFEHECFRNQALDQQNDVAACYQRLGTYWFTEIIPEIERLQPVFPWRRRFYRRLVKRRIGEMRSMVRMLRMFVSWVDGLWVEFHEKWGGLDMSVEVRAAYGEAVNLGQTAQYWEKKVDEVVEEVETYWEGVHIFKDKSD
ncbi:hypothetical protein Vi05172_g4834 [Venturia inaequalis]|nr:hypothetical protein Vi05172_g4834 [Venturia inaequalis]